MSNSFKIIAGLMLVTFAAACAQETEEVVFVEPAAPIVAEPTYSKY